MSNRKDRKDAPWYQQGDVTIKPVADVPAGAQPSDSNVLREGEATGHAHRAVAGDVRLFLGDGRLFMRAPSGTEVRHEEHDVVRVPPGVYEIGGVREYDHFAEEAQEVVD
jgi:hypothetical protein